MSIAWGGEKDGEEEGDQTEKRRAQSSVNSNSVMSSSMVFEHARRCRRLNTVCLFGNGCRCRLEGPLLPHGASMVLKKTENNVGARTHPCLMPLELGKLPDSDPLCFI